MSTTKTVTTEFAWLIRREIWEHKLVTWGPGILAAVMLTSVLASFLHINHVGLVLEGPEDLQTMSSLSQAKLDLIAGGGLVAIALLFLMLANALQFFYAADTLYAERAQRTILFWKSMPVSDLRTVLSKLFVAAVVMPGVALLAAVATELVLALLLGIQFRAFPGVLAALSNPAVWWHALRISVYVFITSALWYLPVVAWMLLISAWMPVARGMRFGRSPMLVAILIPIAIMVAEALALHTKYFYGLIMERVTFYGYFRSMPHGLHANFNGDDLGDMQVTSTLGALADALIHPLTFLASPEVWGGLLFCIPLVAGAVYCRRRSEDRG